MSGAAGAPPDDAAAAGALYFYGVVRARGGWRRSGRADSSADEDMVHVRYRGVAALVRPTHYELPPLDESGVLAHQRTVERVMRQTTILPAPYGIVFRGRRQLVRMLQDQYVALEEGLAFLDGQWELRLHLSVSGGGNGDSGNGDTGLSNLAMRIYTELRQLARAAVPFRHEDHRVLSAAFLVDRTAWLEFMDRAGELEGAHPELTFDVTGPWPAYDFVRIVV